MHVREQIVDAVATAVTSLATTGPRVYKYRIAPLAAANLPGIVVDFGDEPVDDEQSPQGHEYRLLDIEIRGESGGADEQEVVTELNKIASEVEVAMAAALGLGGLSGGHRLTSTSKAMDDTGDGVTGTLTLTYTVQYMTQTGVPDVAV